MPKVGIEPIRRKQLIEATLKSIEDNGLQGTTIGTISRHAGMSSGIISHYFGGKQGVIEAAIRHMLEQLKQGLLAQLREAKRQCVEPRERLRMIVETNFTGFQRSSSTTVTWLSFWAKAVHDPQLARLQVVNARRLYSNLLYSLRQMIDDEQQARDAAATMAALIDGMWLRSVLSHDSEHAFAEAERLCKDYIDIIVCGVNHQCV
ncbi:transcriptional regulator BetI [Bacterioplanes sanyensis]|uniref:HTH-type transcriptional regulator BetI n=1 Tax=Bacterioplanes sanyensis TaxID=1249553 RepID=A0A222FK42_9GAMM|nr:transcriptional regulator BetI [Bacterioplanes sanyensis]ASP39407.1 transcriptional regulator BetI [Bacterioplanes sanyensis]